VTVLTEVVKIHWRKCSSERKLNNVKRAIELREIEIRRLWFRAHPLFLVTFFR
jgi:hypothetical protein